MPRLGGQGRPLRCPSGPRRLKTPSHIQAVGLVPSPFLVWSVFTHQGLPGDVAQGVREKERADVRIVDRDGIDEQHIDKTQSARQDRVVCWLRALGWVSPWYGTTNSTHVSLRIADPSSMRWYCISTGRPSKPLTMKGTRSLETRRACNSSRRPIALRVRAKSRSTVARGVTLSVARSRHGDGRRTWRGRRPARLGRGTP